MVWTIVLAVVAVIGLFIQFYIYILPRLRESRTKKAEDEKIVMEELSRAVKSAESYENIELEEFRASLNGDNIIPIGLGKVFEDACISKRLLRELTQVKELAEEYNQWFFESREVIRAEIGTQVKAYPRLDEAVKGVFGISLEIALPYKTASLPTVQKAIYRRELTFEVAREAVLQGRWDTKVRIKDESGKEEVLLFRDTIEGRDFHQLVEGLWGLYERKSIKALRDVRTKFLEKAQLILKEVFNASS